MAINKSVSGCFLILATCIILFGCSGDGGGGDSTNTLAGQATASVQATSEEIEGSIEKGLQWLADEQNPDGSWGSGCDRVARTALAVLKFEMRAHELDPQMDPQDPLYEYSDQVTNGLAYILDNHYVQAIGPQPAGNPDGDGDGFGVYFADCGAHEIYNTGAAMMALAASGHPELYGEIVQDAVDYMAWAQVDENCPTDDPYAGLDRGGWSYTPNNCNISPMSDNSNSGYAALGLAFAGAAPPFGFGLTVPQFVRDELSIWIDVIQDDVDGDSDDGGSWYRPDWEWVNILKTGNLLHEMAFVGDTADSPRVQDAIDYVERHWADPGGCDTGWMNHRQAMFTMMKGFEALGIEMIDLDDDGVAEYDWFDGVSTHLVDTQNADGSWPGDCWAEPMLSTAWALLTLEKAVPTIEIPVPVDIKPTSCPNPLNVGSKGVLPVAILGTEDFDVSQINPESIALFVRANGNGGNGIFEFVEGPLRWAYEDVAAPFEPFLEKEDCYDCTEEGADGYMDLTLKFEKQEVVNALTLTDEADGACIVVYLRAEGYNGNGAPFIGQDVVRILNKGRR